MDLSRAQPLLSASLVLVGAARAHAYAAGALHLLPHLSACHHGWWVR